MILHIKRAQEPRGRCARRKLLLRKIQVTCSGCINRSGKIQHFLIDEEKSKSASSSVWDTTNKVLGVNTVLGTAGLASAPIVLPSLGTGVVGGCAAAAMGVATAASLVTGVGVIAGMGVAGVKYARAKNDERQRSKSSRQASIEEEKPDLTESGKNEYDPEMEMEEPKSQTVIESDC